jgi:3-oxoacyl-[acyl-carrier-protein] synthase-1/3-oxoacyl-[acyl-carrier-protein] synthase II
MKVRISGIGALCACGLDFESSVSALFQDRRDPAPTRRFQLSHPVPYPVFELPPSSIDEPDENQPWLRTSRLAVTAARAALNDSDWISDQTTTPDLSRFKVGVCIGTTVGGSMNDEKFYRDFREHKTPDLQPITRYLRSNPAAVVAEVFKLHGPQLTVVNACSSGTDAIAIGTEWIKSGLCDIVLAGGSDELCRVTCNGFISLMISSTQPCRPFDENRSGLNLGEGAAILVLESEKIYRQHRKSSPKKEHSSPQAFIAGSGSACDAWHLTAPHPEGRGLHRALQLALDDAEITTDKIAFINAHGTATKNNDLTEGKVLKEMFPDTPFFSTKGYTGHTLGAAGALEAAFTIAMLKLQKIPKSAGFTTIDPTINHAPSSSAQTVSGTCALSQSLAFGGNNSALIIGLEEN